MSGEKVPDEEEEEAFDFGKKKKKTSKKKKQGVEDVSLECEVVVLDGDGNRFEKGAVYAYTDLLKRVQKIIQIQNGDLAAKKKMSVKPPNIVRVSTKKVGWTNFEEICKSLNRSSDHLVQFVLVELATDGSVAGPQLTLKGKFSTKHIESLLRRYIREYVTCKMCSSSNTTLEKDSATRLQVLRCAACQCYRTVVPIKAGFHAQTRADRRRAKELAG
eukprot:GHVR01082238.1.p1 GENE.GHVR01082238.1~~GHVR01082238.1.p1  ORF type:complete len:217 (+),score=28.36 GHVR01082238.1:44-694(+)